MSSGAILAIVVAAIVVLAGLFFITTARSSDRNAATGLLARETTKRDRLRRKTRRATEEVPEAPSGRAYEAMALERRPSGEVVAVRAAASPDVVRAPMDLEQLGVTRRQFLNRSTIIMMTSSIGSFGAACLAFLWPSLSGGFGSKVKVGSLDDILNEIDTAKGPKYVPEARSYLIRYPKDAGVLAKAKSTYSAGVYAGMEQGIAAIYQKCVHLGCKVPWCDTSQWFECPCHGSQYNRVGEYKGGPAPRGLDRFDVAVSGGSVTIDTAGVRVGPPSGTNTTGQEAEGPHCVGGGH